MELSKAAQISTSGMRAQAMRMRVISENLANASTAPGTPDEDPYRRKTISFKNELDRASGIDIVTLDRIDEDQGDFVLKYEPSHPAADDNGYVRMPNVNSLIEAMDMREAQRSYEANMNAMQISRSMFMRTVDMINQRQ